MATEAATEHIWNMHPEKIKSSGTRQWLCLKIPAEFADYLTLGRI